MTDDQETHEEAVHEEDELDALKARAKMLGVRYSPKIGADKLREKIREATAEEVPAEKAAAPAMTELQAKAARRKELRDDATRLIRCRITNMNPMSKDLEGEIFTFRNSVVGTIKKFVPFGEVTDNGYHVPNAIFKQMSARKFLQVSSKPNSKGITEVSQRWAKEFAIEVMDPLTPAELGKLAQAQAARAGL